MPETTSIRLLFATSALLLSACGGGDSGAGTTTPAQSCGLDSDCPNGQKCVNSACQADSGFVGADVAGSSSGGASSGGTSSGADGGATDDANASTGTSSGGTSSGGTDVALCAACQEDKECKDGYGCVLLFNSETHNFCLKKCESASDCTPGFFCTKANSDSDQQFCVPPNSKCDGCTLTGCDAGKKCDYSSDPSVCAEAGAACAGCKVGNDCATGHDCLTIGGAKICVPSCGAGGKCPEASACQKFDTTEACVSLSETCCYGAGCKTSDKCASCPDKCVAGVCVECTKDDHCTDGSCVVSQHTCQQAKCPAEKPHKQATTGLCVECTNDTHCGGKKCLGNVCSDGGQSNECSLCKAPYPGCVQINGQWSCVECAEDADCKTKDAGTCSPKTYTCSGTINGGGPTKGECKADTDCPNGTSSFSLACDTTSGLCYDKDGKCDNVTAFCNAKAGSKCIQLADLFPGGLPSGGGLPGIPGGGGQPGPGGGSPGDGVCSCGGSGGGTGSGPTPACKQFGLNDCDCKADPSSKKCDPLGLGSCCSLGGSGGGAGPLSLLECLAKMQGGGSDPSCFGGTSCLPIGCLFAGMSGGGSSGKADGYCTAQSAP